MLFADADGPRASFSNLLVVADRPRKCCSPTLVDADMSRPKIWRSAHLAPRGVLIQRLFADKVKCLDKRPARYAGTGRRHWSASTDTNYRIWPPPSSPPTRSPPLPRLLPRLVLLHNGPVENWDGCCVWRKIEIVSIIAIFCNNCIVIVSNFKKWHRNITNNLLISLSLQ